MGVHFTPPGRKSFLELAAELLVAIVQQVTAAVEITCVLHRRVARQLLHPARIRMARDAAQRYASVAYFPETLNVRLTQWLE